ncbi:hypothetical protein EJB05_36109, partial [Eragrostis curvula]
IYGIHDEANDKAFELQLSWVCDESNRPLQKLLVPLLYRYQQIFWSEQAKAASLVLEEMDAD